LSFLRPDRIPPSIRGWLRAQQLRFHLQWPPAGTVRFGSLRRPKPVSREFGFDRGLPIDRYYLESFLAEHSACIRGSVLEVGDDRYTRRFGGGRVSRSDVLHIQAGQPGVTIVADLARADHVPSDAFDCILCIQTLQMIYDARAALRNLHRILKPGGTLLLSANGINRTARHEGVDPWGEYWRFTAQSLRRLLAEVFEPNNVVVRSYGNVLAAIGFLHGLAAEELRPEELNFFDEDYEVMLMARAVKA